MQEGKKNKKNKKNKGDEIREYLLNVFLMGRDLILQYVGSEFILLTK